MSKRYSIDIYRTEDAILIHDRPGGLGRGMLLFLICVLCCIPVFVCPIYLFLFDEDFIFSLNRQGEHPEVALWILIATGLFFIPGLTAMAVCIFWGMLSSLWRMAGHETILIDRDSIRHDWWFFLGHRSRILPRPASIQTETEYMDRALEPRRGRDGFDPKPLHGGNYGVSIFFSNRQNLFGMRKKVDKVLPTLAERTWLCDEIARFQQEVPATQPIDEGRPVQKGSLHDYEFGMNVLQSLDWKGKKFQRVIP